MLRRFLPTDAMTARTARALHFTGKRTRRPMDHLFYDQADLVVCDPVAANRATTRSALFALGYRRLEIVANLRDLIDLFAQRCPDLVMCDTQVGVAELCGMVQE